MYGRTFKRSYTLIHSWTYHYKAEASSSDDETSAEERQEKRLGQQQIKKRPAAAISSDDESDDVNIDVRDKNVAIWFRKHESSMSDDTLSQ